MKVTIYKLTPNPKPKFFKKWMGIVGVADDGHVFVPARSVGWSDLTALLIAGWENSPIVQFDKTTLIDSKIILEEANREGFGKESALVSKTIIKIKNRALKAAQS